MPNEVEELRERVALLERQMESMAEFVGGICQELFDDRFVYTVPGPLPWHDEQIRPEDNDGVVGEFVGWWVYTPEVPAHA